MTIHLVPWSLNAFAIRVIGKTQSCSWIQHVWHVKPAHWTLFSHFQMPLSWPRPSVLVKLRELEWKYLKTTSSTSHVSLMPTRVSVKITSSGRSQELKSSEELCWVSIQWKGLMLGNSLARPPISLLHLEDRQKQDMALCRSPSLCNVSGTANSPCNLLTGGGPSHFIKKVCPVH